MKVSVARAHPNIAFVKYWGNLHENLRIPVNSSLSMNLHGLFTETRVSWDEQLASDTLMLNGQPAATDALERVQTHLNAIRNHLQIDVHAHVESINNFPTGAGIASSASGFAALTLAAVDAAGGEATERVLSSLARLGSGSAARSVPAGFVEWHMGNSHETSFAESFADVDYWELIDVIAVVSKGHKSVTSRHGHTAAPSSVLQNARVAGAAERLVHCKQAILDRDFSTFAAITELESNLMHAVMMTSNPPLFYWQPKSLALMQRIRQWREDGLDVCYTLDAGPNVHCLCLSHSAEDVKQLLESQAGISEVYVARTGGGAYIVSQDG